MSLEPQATDATAQVISCDLCILGAGIAGLNALFAATRYLLRDQKVVLVDRRASAGGMWHATRSEIVSHLASASKP
jgi:cation diffusion facilitator CzcD-associated flavoprotein CzcO